jgi:hypothetical protein
MKNMKAETNIHKESSQYTSPKGEFFEIQVIGQLMENTLKLSFDLATIAWGAFFFLWGITEMFPSLPEGTSAIGIGIILIGLILARLWKKEPISGFTTTLGILALLLGTLELARPLLHLSFELPIFAILLLTLGLITLCVR